jgi:predicted CXXCH cytochrome family protein
MKISKLVLMSFFVLGLTQVSNGQIANTKHDFSGGSGSVPTWNTNAQGVRLQLAGQICAPCHAPHNNIASTVPLWSHTLSAGGYTTYTSYRTGTAAPAPDGSSKLCLSCHDGSVALAAFKGNVSALMTTKMGDLSSGVNSLGSDLSNDHPISFTYDATLVTAAGKDAYGNNKLNDPDAANGSTITATGSITHDMLESGKVQCKSCHDPHNNTYSPFLVKDNTGSKLCLVCHNK